jgi:CubicO group peptidase (beta-lactamase class C family)
MIRKSSCRAHLALWLNQNIMLRLLYIALLCFSFLGGSAQKNEIPEKNWVLVSSYLEQQTNFSGMIMLGMNGEIKINQGFGYADRGKMIPYSDQSLYTIGSITKPFTATAIMLLYDKAKISLTDPIDLYFKNVPEDKRKITIHQLLTHSSGLPGAIGDDYEAIDNISFQQRTWEHPLQFIPGSGYEYSNVGYSLLGMIVEKVSGENYSTFLQNHIFKPAGMTTAGYQNPDADYTRLAHGYTSEGKDWGTSHDKTWNEGEPYWHLKANGGLLMSAMDMYHWYLALKENKVLKPELLKLQTTPYVDEGGGSFYSYGYAVDTDGVCVQHNGSNRIFKADFRWFPKSDFFLFSASNDANVKLFRLNDEIVNILMTGELPVADHWQPVSEDAFPADKNQETAKAFIELLNSYSDQKADTFIPEYCSPDMIKRNGEARLKEVFGMLHNDADHQSAKMISSSGDKIQINMDTKDGDGRLKITLSMTSHKIDRIGAEIEGK